MISVAMTTFNGEKYILEQLKSIAEQELAVDEVVIFDDASQDNTVSLIEQYRNKTNINIKLYVNKKNQGYVQNFRNAIQKAQGDYIFLCDQDDIWNTNKTKLMIETIKKYNISVLFTQYNMIDENGEPLDISDYKFNGEKKYGRKLVKKISLAQLVYGNIAPGCTYCFTKEIRKLYLREVKEPIIHDYAVALIGACIGKSYYMNEKTMSYRIHSSNCIGVKKKSEKVNMRFQGRRKPYILAFLENYSDITTMWTRIRVAIILYLRLPILKSYVKKYIK